jgi:hypothetical protein
MILKKILHYLNPLNLFKKEQGDLNLRMMHGINKISILIFVIALTVLVIRWMK